MSATEIVIAVVATAGGLAAIAIDYSDGGSLTVAAIAAAVTVGIAVLLFVGAVPRAGSADHIAESALVTSVVGFLSVASAWTGLPFVLGAGGAMLGRTARHEVSHPRQRTFAGFAVALGVSAVMLGLLAVAAV